MAKYFGKIGFAETKETSPGVWTEVITEKNYYGEVTRNSRRLDGSGVNSDISVSNTISIIADAYANRNFFSMRYLTWMGARWKISDVEVQHPRLILTLGGLYNVETEN